VREARFPGHPTTLRTRRNDRAPGEHPERKQHEALLVCLPGQHVERALEHQFAHAIRLKQLRRREHVVAVMSSATRTIASPLRCR
jgi:hypothetical protein